MTLKNDDYFAVYLDEIQEAPRRSCFARLPTILMVFLMLAALLGGSVYQAWNFVPWILGYWNSSYQITISEVYTGECGTQRYTSGTIINVLCICATLDAGTNGRADFGISVRNENDEIVARIALHERSTGNFCVNMLLDKQLSTGLYTIGIKPRLARSEILRTRVQIMDPSSQV